MPVALQVPWSEIQSKYISGVKPKQLSQEYGVKPDTISCRAKRENWIIAMRQVRQAVQACIPQTLVAQGKAVREQLSSVIASDSQALAALAPAESLNQISKRQSVAGQLVSNAKEVYGWETESRHSIVITTQDGLLDYSPPIEIEASVEPNTPSDDVSR